MLYSSHFAKLGVLCTDAQLIGSGHNSNDESGGEVNNGKAGGHSVNSPRESNVSMGGSMI